MTTLSRKRWNWSTQDGLKPAGESVVSRQPLAAQASFLLFGIQRALHLPAFICRCKRACCYCLVISDFATPWTVARQAPLSMRFPRQEYWSGLSFPPPGDLAYPEIQPASPAGGFFTNELPGKPLNSLCPSPNFGSA